MKQKAVWMSVLVAAAATLAGATLAADDGAPDFGWFVEQQLRASAEALFGVGRPLAQSALGPFTGADSTEAIELARGLKATLVSSAAHSSADQIALYPDDRNPRYLFVCDESVPNPAVQRIDLTGPAAANATTIVTGLSACDPVRRTPWGTILVGEETTSGGLYEIFQPADIATPVAVTNRATGATSDPRVVKLQAVGQLAFEGLAILPDGTMYYADELRPGNGASGGGLYKFVPDFPASGGPVTVPAQSPFASGRVFGLKIGSAGDNGQGTEIGQGAWTAIDAATYRDANGNTVLRSAQAALRLNGFYRPEDMDFDPLAMARGAVRACVANTGRMSNGGGSAVETGAIYGEVVCLTDTPAAAAAGGAIPAVERFIAGDRQANYFDNLAFQPRTGNLVVLEDGEVEVVKADGTAERRGNDIWMCLPDGSDRDVQSDGCIRIASLRDTDSEPTGFIFTASGDTAFVGLQHRSTGGGALLKITGFKVRKRREADDREDRDR